MTDQGERLQKLLASLGLASRREAETWIRAGRVTLNGTIATLGVRVGARDEVRLDGRPIRRHAIAPRAAAFLANRSPGESLQHPDESGHESLMARMPARSGRRFVAVSPMPRIDGGLEIFSPDGEVAARLQRAARQVEIRVSRARSWRTAVGKAGLRAHGPTRQWRTPRCASLRGCWWRGQQSLVCNRHARRERQEGAAAVRAPGCDRQSRTAHPLRCPGTRSHAAAWALTRAHGCRTGGAVAGGAKRYERRGGPGAWASTVCPVIPRAPGPSRQTYAAVMVSGSGALSATSAG